VFKFDEEVKTLNESGKSTILEKIVSLLDMCRNNVWRLIKG